jgi:TonB family protein
MRPAHFSLALFWLLIFAPISARPQGPIPPPQGFSGMRPPYSNSSDGLRWQLQDALNAARTGNRSNLDSLIRQTEIPNERQWFLYTFGTEKGTAWATSYENNFDANEKALANQLARLAAEDGEFIIRRVNDQPAPARKIENGMIDALQRPVNIFFTGWKKRDSPPGSNFVPIGYFVFLEGRFRLDSAVNASELANEPDFGSVSPTESAAPASAESRKSSANPPAVGANPGVSRPGVGGVGYPSCAYCPDPGYTKAARKKHLEGTVTLTAIIQPTGDLSELRVLRSPDEELTQMALDGVAKWHMNPARLASGEPVPVIVPIEVTFRLVK